MCFRYPDPISPDDVSDYDVGGGGDHGDVDLVQSEICSARVDCHPRGLHQVGAGLQARDHLHRCPETSSYQVKLLLSYFFFYSSTFFLTLSTTSGFSVLTRKSSLGSRATYRRALRSVFLRIMMMMMVMMMKMSILVCDVDANADDDSIAWQSKQPHACYTNIPAGTTGWF